jgi:hypothetical protein
MTFLLRTSEAEFRRQSAALLDGLPDRLVGDSIEDEGSSPLRPRDPRIFQDTQMVRHQRLREPGLRNERGNGLALHRHGLKELQTCRFSENPEELGNGVV